MSGAQCWASRIAIVAALAAPVHTMAAQATPGTLSGVVRDSAGRPLREAVVVLDPTDESRATRTNVAGQFRFIGVRAKRYLMRTTWIGYQPDERTIDVPLSGLDVAVTLTPVPYRLDTLTVVATRTGIYGTTIERGDSRALGGVDVRVLGTGIAPAPRQMESLLSIRCAWVAGWLRHRELATRRCSFR